MRMEQAASCRWPPDVAALGTRHSSAVKANSELPPSPFPSIAPPLLRETEAIWPGKVPPALCAMQRVRLKKKKKKACTITHNAPSPQKKSVTWLLTHRSCSPAVLHYDKNSEVTGCCQPGVSPQTLYGVHLQPFKAHFAEDLQPFSSSYPPTCSSASLHRDR